VRRRKARRRNMGENRSPWRKKKGFQELQRNKVMYFLLSLLIAFLFLVAGCGGSSPPSPPPQKVKSPSVEKKVGGVKVAEKKEAEKKEQAEYAYNPAGKPDPFKPFMQLAPGKEFSRAVPLTPLQKYDVSQLKLVAIITSSEGNIALVEDSTGKGYSLRKGTGIGRNDGRVKKIVKDRVIIEEVHEDIFGQKKIREISLFLHRVEEGGES
jgi:type IV pilus assembly protein PilP